MRRSVIVTVGVFLALFVVFSTVVFSSSPAGEVVYRQRFKDVSSLASAGITEGKRNTASSSVSILNGSLVIGDPTGDRTYALLPFHNCYSDYTVQFTFSFTETVRQSGYIALMLTSRGDAPDNVTSVRLRADGECEGFADLGPRIRHSLKNGEEITVTVPVSGGILESITLSSDGVSETADIDNIVNVVEGRMGFCVRNAEVQISDIAVIEGVGYDKETGIYADSSTWTDETPYTSPASYARDGINLCCESEPYISVIEAPSTGDSLVSGLVSGGIALVVFTAVLRRKKKV